MPKIMELKEIDGEIWARIGKPPDFPSGVALWTPNEVAQFRKLTARDATTDLVATLQNIVDFATQDDIGDYIVDCDLRTDYFGKARKAIAKAKADAK